MTDTLTRATVGPDQLAALINQPGTLLAAIEHDTQLTDAPLAVTQLWDQLRDALSTALPAIAALRNEFTAPATYAYGDPVPPVYDTEQIHHLLRWIEVLGTGEGVWEDVQADDEIPGSITRDRMLLLRAAAFMDRARLLGELEPSGLYDPVEAAVILAEHLRAFDAEHGTSRGVNCGAFGPEDLHWRLVGTIPGSYVAQEWSATFG